LIKTKTQAGSLQKKKEAFECTKDFLSLALGVEITRLSEMEAGINQHDIKWNSLGVSTVSSFISHIEKICPLEKFSVLSRFQACHALSEHFKGESSKFVHYEVRMRMTENGPEYEGDWNDVHIFETKDAYVVFWRVLPKHF